MKLIDTVCRGCRHITRDVWVENLQSIALHCHLCGATVERAWAFVKAPGITPQGTRAEINTDPLPKPKHVDTKAIAVETMQEVQQKWLRYSDETIAEQHVSREINEKAGLADAQGNLKPTPTPPPITFEKPSISECAV